ncbi:hypothetical protein L3i22_030080 [Actinoplanes sp. L3-i22]|nr:hypothetical protein L3i22_030080 [Actinoplanes sp. L3-i22]
MGVQQEAGLLRGQRPEMAGREERQPGRPGGQEGDPIATHATGGIRDDPQGRGIEQVRVVQEAEQRAVG